MTADPSGVCQHGPERTAIEKQLVEAFNPTDTLRYLDIKDFLRVLNTEDDESPLVVDLSRVDFAYPGAMVPLVATLHDLRVRGRDVDVRLPTTPSAVDYFERAGWTAALNGAGGAVRRPARSTFVPIMSFADHQELTEAMDATVNMVSGVSEYPAGVLRAIEWALNETADNVLQHAGDGVIGWMQAISQPRAGRIEFAVADRGRGILASLSERYTDLVDDRNALVRAVEPGVTRNTRVGQGNGLSGSFRIARATGGWMNLLSGSGELRVVDVTGVYTQATAHYAGTVLDFTLPTAAEVDIADALWGHEPVSTLELAHTSGDEVVFKVRDESTGFGNRGSGREIANKLSNLMTEMPGDRITIDFEDVDFLTASFADEFLAKLIKRYGVGSFLGRVTLANMSPLVARTLNAVIAQRMAADD